MGSDWSCSAGDDRQNHLQNAEPQRANPPVPLPGDGVRHHCPSTDPLPAGTGHQPKEAGTGGGATCELDPSDALNDL